MRNNALRNRGPRRGLALALVLLVVAVAVVLGLCFLSAGATAAPVSKMVDERLKARMIAESGLDMTLAHLRRGTGWRTARPEGQWVTRQPFDGGTFSIWGYDGEDTNGDGVLEGNGVFADDPFAAVTLTALAEYGGVRHSVKAVYRPAGPPAVAVGEYAGFLNNALLDSYDARVAPYSAATAGAAAVVSSNSTGRPNITLSNNAIISGNFYFPRGSDPSLALNITGSAKITGVIGKLQADEIAIAPIVPPDCTPSTTDVTYNGTQVTMTGDVICRDFKLLGSSILRVPANYKIVCDRNFVADNTAQIILANPRYGFDVPFAGSQNAVNNQQVATLVTVPDEVEVVSIAAYIQKAGKDVRYALYADKNGAPGALLVQSGRQPVQQDTFYWHEMPVTPTKIAPGAYWLAVSVETGAPFYSVGAGGVTVHRYYDGLSRGFLSNWGNSDETHVKSVNIYLTGNVAGKGGSLDVYTSGKITLGGASRFNLSTQMPSRLKFWHDDPDEAGEAAVRGIASGYATIHAPYATVRVTDWAQFNGVLRASHAILEKLSVTRVDSSGGPADPGMLIGQGLKMTDSARVEGLWGTPAVVTSCSVGSPVIYLRNKSVVKGDAYGGPGGTGGNSEIQVGSDALLTGKRRNLFEAVDMSKPAPPAGLPVMADKTVSSGTTVISSSFQSGNLTIDGTGVVEIRGNVTAVVRELHLHQNGRLRLAPDARLTLFVTGRLHVVDDSELNLGGDPSRVTLNISGLWVDVRGRARVCAALVAPGALLRVTEDAHLFGTVRSRWLLLDENGRIHADVRPERVRWMEQ